MPDDGLPSSSRDPARDVDVDVDVHGHRYDDHLGANRHRGEEVEATLTADNPAGGLGAALSRVGCTR
jgi:hypothetical protein